MNLLDTPSDTPTALADTKVVQLDGPPSELDALLTFIAVQFGSQRCLVGGREDRGLSDQFRRLRDEWQRGSRQSLWYGVRSASTELSALAVLTKRGATWSNRGFAGGAALSEFAYGYTDKTRTMGLREFTLKLLEQLPHEHFPVRVYGYALSQAVGYWARCAPAMGAVAAHNLIGVPTWIWLDRSLVGQDLREPAAGAEAVRRFPERYTSGPALDPAITLSVGTVRASDSPFGRVVRDEAGRPHALSLTPELASVHEQRVAAAFAALPAERRALLCQHFARLGLAGAGRGAVLAFWLRFIPIILLEDRPGLWPALDRISKLGELDRSE
jgi:hypothetical protein